MSIEYRVSSEAFRFSAPEGRELLSRQQLVQLFFATDESDFQVADFSALQMAQRHPIFEQSSRGVRSRRCLPPRRHLRE